MKLKRYIHTHQDVGGLFDVPDNSLDLDSVLYGTDDKKGWCLSKDASDATRSWKGYVSRGCNRKMEFHADGRRNVAN